MSVKTQFAIGLSIFLLASASSTSARTVTLTVEFKNDHFFDYVAGAVFSPFSGTASISFDVDGPITYTDYGPGSFSYFNGTSPPLNGALLSSSISDLIPKYVRNAVVPSNSYAFQFNYDYPSSFTEQFAARTDASATDGDYYFTSSLSIYTRFWNGKHPQNGDGTSDFFYTADQVIEFLQSGVGREAWFTQSYSVFKQIPGGGAHYSDGKSWEDYSAIITSVTVSSVPEISSLPLGLTALALLTAFQRSRRRSAPRHQSAA